MNRFTILTLGTLLLGIVAVAHSQNPTRAGRSIAVENALVTLIHDTKVPASDMGMLMAIHIQEGAWIEEGQLLADIDNRETLAKQRIAQGELEAARTQAESTAELEVAEEAVKVAQAELQSTREIREKNPGAISETELRKFVFQLQRAQAQTKLAKTDRVIAGMTAKVKEAQLDATAIELDRRQVKAPFRGQVDEVFKKVGEWVQPGEPIARLVGLDRLRVKGFVRAELASPAEVMGKPVVISVYSPGGRTHTVRGTVGFASQVIEGQGSTASFRIWAEIDNQRVIDPVTKFESWAIQPGTEATMTIDLAAIAQALPSRPPLTPVAAENNVQPEIRPAVNVAPQLGVPTPAAPPARAATPAPRTAPGRAYSFKPVLTGPGDTSEDAGEKENASDAPPAKTNNSADKPRVR